MPPTCSPREIALKSLFLGPQAENAEWLRDAFGSVLGNWFEWRRSRFPADGSAISREDQAMPEFVARQERFAACLRELEKAFEAELAKFSPRYFGHMFSEVSLPALTGHFLTLLHNPNNISGESSRVGTRIEKESIAFLAKMVGYETTAPGHFTSGGTIANFEAMLRARERLYRRLESDLGLERHASPFELGERFRERHGRDFKGPVVLAPAHAHYSWAKACHALGLGKRALWKIALDERGRLSVSDLERRMKEAREADRPVLMVVSVAGTTEFGSLDPVDEVARVLAGTGIWHHVDAAYGGFFATLLGDAECEATLPPEGVRALRAMADADSVTLDPHKLGYVPYSCGAFVCRDPRDYQLTTQGADYVQFDPLVDRGQTTLEGSRSAAGASATWLTARTIGLDGAGYGSILRRTIRGRQKFCEALLEHVPGVRILPAHDTNIACFFAHRSGDTLAQVNQRTQRLFERLGPSGDEPFCISKTKLSRDTYGQLTRPDLDLLGLAGDDLWVLRACIMNPFFDSKELAIDLPRAFARRLAELVEE